MRSGVAMAVSNSIQPPWTRSTRSSAPTTSAPASRASRSFSPFAKTATRTVLPIPCGSTTAPRTIWSACLGSTPSRNDRSTDWSNFVGGMLLMIATASSSEYCLPGPIFAAAASYRLLTTVAMSVSLTPIPLLASDGGGLEQRLASPVAAARTASRSHRRGESLLEASAVRGEQWDRRKGDRHGDGGEQAVRCGGREDRAG